MTRLTDEELTLVMSAIDHDHLVGGENVRLLVAEVREHRATALLTPNKETSQHLTDKELRDRLQTALCYLGECDHTRAHEWDSDIARDLARDLRETCVEIDLLRAEYGWRTDLVGTSNVAKIIRARLAGQRATELTAEERGGLAFGEHRAARPSSCPCSYVTPCHERCTCVNGFSSSGCSRCCTYGSLEQRTSAAQRLADMHRTAELTEDERETLQWFAAEYRDPRDWVRPSARRKHDSALAALDKLLGGAK